MEEKVQINQINQIVKNPVPEEISIGTVFTPDFTLTDKRVMSRGIVFGTIGNVAKQYGIKMRMNGPIYIYTAPKSRLQLFVEKLHFAKVPYFDV